MEWYHNWHTHTIGIYIAGLECSKAKYPERPADNDLFIEHNYYNIIKTPAPNSYSQSLDAKDNGAIAVHDVLKSNTLI